MEVLYDVVFFWYILARELFSSIQIKADTEMSDEKKTPVSGVDEVQRSRPLESTDTLRVMETPAHSQKPLQSSVNRVVEKKGRSSSLVAELLVQSQIKSGRRRETLNDLLSDYEL